MNKALIYIRQKENENIKEFLKNSEVYIQSIKKEYTIIAVIADSHNDNSQLYDFVNNPHQEIDFLILDDLIQDPFDRILLNQLAKTEKFRIHYMARE